MEMMLEKEDSNNLLHKDLKDDEIRLGKVEAVLRQGFVDLDIAEEFHINISKKGNIILRNNTWNMYVHVDSLARVIDKEISVKEVTFNDIVELVVSDSEEYHKPIKELCAMVETLGKVCKTHDKKNMLRELNAKKYSNEIMKNTLVENEGRLNYNCEKWVKEEFVKAKIPVEDMAIELKEKVTNIRKRQIKWSVSLSIKSKNNSIAVDTAIMEATYHQTNPMNERKKIKEIEKRVDQCVYNTIYQINYSKVKAFLSKKANAKQFFEELNQYMDFKEGVLGEKHTLSVKTSGIYLVNNLNKAAQSDLTNTESVLVKNGVVDIEGLREVLLNEKNRKKIVSEIKNSVDNLNNSRGALTLPTLRKSVLLQKCYDKFAEKLKEHCENDLEKAKAINSNNIAILNNIEKKHGIGVSFDNSDKVKVVSDAYDIIYTLINLKEEEKTELAKKIFKASKGLIYYIIKGDTVLISLDGCGLKISSKMEFSNLEDINVQTFEFENEAEEKLLEMSKRVERLEENIDKIVNVKNIFKDKADELNLNKYRSSEHFDKVNNFEELVDALEDNDFKVKLESERLLLGKVVDLSYVCNDEFAMISIINNKIAIIINIFNSAVEASKCIEKKLLKNKDFLYILEAIANNEGYGKTTYIDIVYGANNKKMIEYNMINNKSYGVLGKYKKAEIDTLFDKLFAMGLLRVYYSDGDKYNQYPKVRLAYSHEDMIGRLIKDSLSIDKEEEAVCIDDLTTENIVRLTDEQLKGILSQNPADMKKENVIKIINIIDMLNTMNLDKYTDLLVEFFAKLPSDLRMILQLKKNFLGACKAKTLIESAEKKWN